MHNGMNVLFVNKWKSGNEKSLLARYVTYVLKSVICFLLPFFPVYRGFWTVLMLLGVITIVMASFLIICAAPFASHILYKAGGGFYILAGEYIVCSIN